MIESFAVRSKATRPARLHAPGGEATQFWWIVGLTILARAAMFAWFRRAGWL